MHKTKRFSTIGLGFLLLVATASAYAQPGKNWDYLGEANVDGQVDHDSIKVTGSQGTFRAIRLRVENAPIEFDHVVVHYGNGATVPIQIRSKIPAGGQTRVIDLPGDRRIIESVELWYARASGSPAKPKVRLWGLR
ncbi:MAG TPA: hypothetical protein VKU01_25135 [Bryobacteraceae bacterium]|nr:hypothetical protein [Bryobacteraceae bacterium]